MSKDLGFPDPASHQPPEGMANPQTRRKDLIGVAGLSEAAGSQTHWGPGGRDA